MPYNELIEGYKLPCTTASELGCLDVVDATGRDVCFCYNRLIAQLIADKLNEQYYAGLLKAVEYQQRGHTRAETARYFAGFPLHGYAAVKAQREAAEFYATARDVLGVE